MQSNFVHTKRNSPGKNMIKLSKSTLGVIRKQILTSHIAFFPQKFVG